MIRGVLFDKDDTLLDLATFWRRPVQHTVAFMLHELGRDDDAPLRQALEAACGFDGDRLIPESPVVAGTNADVIAACMAVLAAQGITTFDDRLFARLSEAMLERTCLRDGVCKPTGDLHAVFNALHAAGCKTGVATSDSCASTHHALEAMGVTDAVDLVLTADRVARPKPAPDMAEIFAARFGLAPEDLAMVGDSANDMRFARNSGMTAIYFDRDGRAASGAIDADAIVHRLEDGPTLIGRF